MYYRQTRYLNDFKCIGGTCTNSCCIGWRIDWSEEEINKVKNDLKCSEELKELFEKRFIYDKKHETNIVVLGKDKRCPFLTEDNFCKIQRELGAEYLGNTCTIYPRVYVVTKNVIYRHCYMTCPEVMKKIIYDEKSMDLVNVPIKKKYTLKVSQLDSPEKIKKHPEFKYASEIKDFFYEIISNRKLPLESCIILGALAAQSLTKLVSTGDYGAVPEAIKTLRAQMHNPEQLKNIGNIKPNYNVKLGVTDKLMREFTVAPSSNTFFDDDGKLNIDLYKRAEQLLDKKFEDRPFVWRNLALNLLLELNVPLKLEDSTIFENYSVFVMCYAFLRYSTLTVVDYDDKLSAPKKAIVSEGSIKLSFNIVQSVNITEHIVSSGASISRFMCHNNDNLKKILKRLQDFKMTSPAYLALLVR